MFACANKLPDFVYFLFFFTGGCLAVSARRIGAKNPTHSGSGYGHFCFFLDDSAFLCSFPFVSTICNPWGLSQRSKGVVPDVKESQAVDPAV